MQWWNEFVNWLDSTEGQRLVTTAIIPFVAIVIAGVVAALIARSSTKRVLAYQDRELKASAVTALIGAGRKAAVWSSLSNDEKQRIDLQLNEADIRVRLLPINGTSAAADWAAHELGAMKKNSANFSFQADQTFVDYRNRLLEWQSKPKRARKLFAFDLEQWRFDDEATAKKEAERQQQWAAQQGVDATPELPNPTPTYVAPTAAVLTPVVIADDNASATTESPREAPATPVTAETNETAAGESDGDTAVLPESATPPVADNSVSNEVSDAASETDAPTEENFAPPVTAGTVRRRTNPDQDLDERGDY